MTEAKEMSFISSDEEASAAQLIIDNLKTTTGFDDFELPRATGYHMWVKLYVRAEDVYQVKDNDGKAIVGKDGKPMYIALPESARANDKWGSCVALVIEKGPECYKGKRFEQSKPWCRVGDWVVIPRNEGIQVSYRGIPMQLIPDDRVLSIIKDPTYVTRD